MKRSAALFLFFSTVLSQTGLALIHAQAGLGKRWYSTEDSGEKYTFHGQGGVLAVHLDPIPLVPIAAGASFSLINLDTKDFAVAPTAAAIAELALDVEAWLPMVPIITPYLKVQYALNSKMKVEYGNPLIEDVDAKIKGYHLTLGIRYKLVPLAQLYLEVEQGTQQISDLFTEARDLKSNGAFLGISVGF